MTAVAGFSEYFVTVFCLLLFPADAKEMLLTIAHDNGPGETIRFVRTEKGCDVFSYHDEKRPIATISPVKGKPNVHLMTVQDKSRQEDLSKAAGLLKPPSKHPDQKIRLAQGAVRIQARGDVIFLNFQGQKKTYVIHGLGQKPAPAAATKPAEAVKPKAQPSGRGAARTFWDAFAKGDLKAAGRFYADEVTIIYHSHMHRKQYGVTTTDNVTGDLTVNRARLMAGYAAMLKKVGKEKWVKAYAAIVASKITITTAAKADQPIRGVRKGDVVLNVAPVPDEGLTFVFRPDKQGRYRIVVEKNDY